MRLALVQQNLTVGDLAGNRDLILRAVQQAQAQHADIAITSELALLGYPPRDLLERPAFVRKVAEENQRLIDALPAGIVVVLGTIEAREGAEGRALHNSALVVRRGEVLARAHKRLLPTYDVFDEDRYFEPGDRAARVELACGTLGITICEDAWNDEAVLATRAYGAHSLQQTQFRPRYHQNPVTEVTAGRIDLLVNVSASPFTLSKRVARPNMFAEIARHHRVPLAFVNQVGANDELLFDGRSTLFGPDGSVLARAAAFSPEVLICDLASGGDRAVDLLSEEDAAYRALVMGTRDYARKCGFTKAVFGLSGGIDSALTAVIAADALGATNVLGVAMPTRYSSPGSRADAADLANNLGVEFREIPIEGIFASYINVLEPGLDALAQARPGDVTFENVQARVRGNVLMAISNRTGALLLTTGNKSEVGVGYCTLYGDMAGGLAVISDVPKTMVYRLSRYVNREGERIPNASIDKAPSAELRPDQTDQDSLPPYDQLDAILERFVEDGADRASIVAAGFSETVVDRVLTLVQGSEYKRRQAAPGLILTKKAFGMGRRMPIAQKFRE